VSDRYAHLVARLRSAVLDGPAVTPPPVRRAAAARAAELGGGPPSAAPELPENLRRFVETIARHAVDVRQEDVDALKAAGYSEDAIFEIAVSSALGAGLGRLERGLAALKGAP
jgi:hypothetical protein